MPILQPALQVLIDRERDRLARRHPHDARRDALVERVHAFLAEHIGRNGADAAYGRDARRAGHLLQPGFDGVDRGVAERAHGAAHQADAHGLPAGELAVVVRGL